MGIEYPDAVLEFAKEDAERRANEPRR